MLMLIRGLPGSGKSTLAQTLKDRGAIDAFHEADQYFYNSQGQYEWDPLYLLDAHDWCRTQVEQSLDQGLRVAVSNTTLRLRDIRAFVEIARDFDALPLQVITMRSEYGSIHGVPDETIERMRLGFADDAAILERFGDDVQLMTPDQVLTSS